MRTDSELTMCLCNWQRTEQTHAIIDELCQQSVKPVIFVWNNNPDVLFKNDKADLVINCSENMHVRHVPALWQMARTAFVGRMDDDLHFREGDTDVLADALATLRRQRHATQMVGPYGVRVFADSSYTDGHHVSIPKGHGQYTKDGPVKPQPHDVKVDLLKGRLLLANIHATAQLLANCPHYHVDLYISMVLSSRQRLWHVAAGCFFDREKEEARLVDFPLDKEGYCLMSGHNEDRNQLVNSWVAQCAPDVRVKKKPPKENPPPVQVPDS